MFEFLIPLLKPFLSYIGFACGALGVLLYLPQIVRAYQTKSTLDIAINTYRFILLNDVLWFFYGVGLDNPFIYIPNGVSIGLCMTILLQKIRYDTRTRNSR